MSKISHRFLEIHGQLHANFGTLKEGLVAILDHVTLK